MLWVRLPSAMPDVHGLSICWKRLGSGGAPAAGSCFELKQSPCVFWQGWWSARPTSDMWVACRQRDSMHMGHMRRCLVLLLHLFSGLCALHLRVYFLLLTATHWRMSCGCCWCMACCTSVATTMSAENRCGEQSERTRAGRAHNSDAVMPAPACTPAALTTACSAGVMAVSVDHPMVLHPLNFSLSPRPCAHT